MRFLVFVVACALATSCAAGDPDTTASTPPVTAAPATTPPAFIPPSPSPAPGVTAPAATRTAAIGSRLTLTRTGGATVDVNVMEVADPARGRIDPPEGTRWVAVRIEISNPGGPTYTEMPADAARLIDAGGDVYAGWASDPVRPGFDGDVRIRAGNFERGFVAFSVPLDAKPAAIRFTPDARTAPDTGEWRF